MARPDPSHLAIDGVGAKFGGAATVLLELVHAALDHPQLEKVSVFCSPQKRRLFHFPYHPSLEVLERPTVDRNRAARLWWLEHGLAREVRRLGAGRLLCLGGGGLPPAEVASALCIQRIQPFSTRFPSERGLFEPLRAHTLEFALKQSARRCTRVFVQSQTVRERVAGRLSLDQDKLRVFEPAAMQMPAGPPHPAVASMRQSPAGRRVLYVGSAAPHKDLVTLRKAMWLLRKSEPAELFVTLAPAHPMARGEGLHGLGYLDPTALRQAYEQADVVVLTSVDETVGLPLIEAMHFGKAIVAPDLPYAHDACGDAAEYFKAGDPHAAAETIRKLLRDSELRARLGARGRAREARRRASLPYHRMIDSLRFDTDAEPERHAHNP